MTGRRTLTPAQPAEATEIEEIAANAWVPLSLATLFAAVVQGLMGFGFVLLALSLFLLALGPHEAVQLLVVISLAITLFLAWRSWSSAPRPLLGRMIIGASVGFPLGLVGFVRADAEVLRVAAAIVILLSAGLIAFQRNSEPEGGAPSFRSGSAGAVGLLSGAMTSSVGMAGPPLVLYLTAIGSDKSTLRSAAFCFFAFCYGATLLMMTLTVGIEPRVWSLSVVLVPVAVVGSLVGHTVSVRVHETLFRRLVLVLIAGTAGYTLVTTLMS